MSASSSRRWRAASSSGWNNEVLVAGGAVNLTTVSTSDPSRTARLLPGHATEEDSDAFRSARRDARAGGAAAGRHRAGGLRQLDAVDQLVRRQRGGR